MLPGEAHQPAGQQAQEDLPGLRGLISVTARRATQDDLPELLRLYRLLETEMVGLKAMWRLDDGLGEPLDEALATAVERDFTFVGEIDGSIFGFLLARSEELLPQADGRRKGVIRLVFVEQEARGVGVGAALRDSALELLRADGHTLFDAHVLPGHRLAKNFFEAGGFAARSIVMHHDDDA